MDINYKDKNFKEVESCGNFTLFLNYPRYSKITCSGNGIIYDTITGEEFGQEKDLCVNLYDSSFNLLSEPEFEDAPRYSLKPKRGDTK